MTFARQKLTESFSSICFAPELETKPLFFKNPALFSNQVVLFYSDKDEETVRKMLKDIEQRSGGVFNGDIGRVETVDNRSETITVDFEGRVVEYTPDMLGELESAYAITVHKAQGSEYRAVILAACDGAPMLLTRGVLYTAITRARELLIIVGDEEVVARMTANDRQQRRYSGLRWRLAGGTA